MARDVQVSDLFAALQAAKVSPTMSNPGTDLDLTSVSHKITMAVDAARTELAERRRIHDEALEERLLEPAKRLSDWEARSQTLALNMDRTRRSDADRYTAAVSNDTMKLIESLRTRGEPLVRVLAVLVPGEDR